MSAPRIWLVGLMLVSLASCGGDDSSPPASADASRDVEPSVDAAPVDGVPRDSAPVDNANAIEVGAAETNPGPEIGAEAGPGREDAAAPDAAIDRGPSDAPVTPPGPDAREAGTATPDASPEVGGVDHSILTTLPIEAQHVVYDRTRNLLYVSVAGDARNHANTIVSVDPVSGAIVATLPVGSDPGPLAISDDGAALWVGITGAFSIRKITLQTATSPAVVGPLVHLLPDQHTDYGHRAETLVALPGTPNAVAVATSDNVTGSVLVVDGATQRTMTVRAPAQAPAPFVLGPPGTIFGLGESKLAVISVSAGGVSQTLFPTLFGRETGGLYSAGRLYLNGGAVLDVSNPAAPVRAGAFAFQGVLAERDSQTLLMITPDVNEPAYLRFLSTTTFAQVVAPLQVPRQVADSYTADLVYTGDDGVAFISREAGGKPGQLVLWHAPVIRAPTAGADRSDGGTEVRANTADGGVGASDDCAGCSFVTSPARGRQFVYDQKRNSIYLTAGSGTPSNKNSVVKVDPTTGSVVSAVAVGVDPGPITLSDDASTLWIGEDAEHTVRSVTIEPSLVAGPQFPLPDIQQQLGRPVASSIVALPDGPTSIAVATSGQVGPPAVLVLDAGVPRATRVQTGNPVDVFLVRGPPGLLFGFNRFTDFAVLTTSSAGITQTAFDGLIGGNNIRSLAYLDGRVFASDGPVIDVSNPAKPVRVGVFPHIGAFALRSSTRALMLVTRGSPPFVPVLRVLDTTTFTTVATATLPVSVAGQLAILGPMAYIGGDAIAFLIYTNDSYELHIMHATVIGSPP
jgi:hypothetical protein